MKYKVKISALIAFVLVLFGHAQNRPNDSITGHYVSDQNSAEYLDLKLDGNFTWRVGGRDFAGSYQASGNVLTLRFPPVGATARGRLIGEQFNCCLSNGLGPAETKLIDDESKNWVRRGALSPASGQNSASSQVADGHTAEECPAKFPNPVLPDACLGEFRHGTPVRKMGLGGAVDLVKATPATATNTHPGVDFVQLDKNGSPQCGGPIYPLADGEVVDLISDHNDPDWKYLGYMVMIHHASAGDVPNYTLYLHMQGSPNVALHQQVHAGSGVGSQLGRVGNTGAAAGCHTHFEIRHFPTRYLEDCSWSFPSNIYGKGYLAKSRVFEENWEDPEIVIANNNRLPDRSIPPRQSEPTHGCPSAATNGTGAKNAELPSSIQTILDRDYPGWVPVQTRADDIATCKQPNPGFQYWFVWGDFNGDGKRDYAAEITQQSTTYLLAFLATADGFKSIMVDKFPVTGSARGWSVLGVAPKGSTVPDLHEGPNGQLVARKRTLYSDALLGIGCESSSMAYIFVGSSFQRVFTSD